MYKINNLESASPQENTIEYVKNGIKIVKLFPYIREDEVDYESFGRDYYEANLFTLESEDYINEYILISNINSLKRGIYKITMSKDYNPFIKGKNTFAVSEVLPYEFRTDFKFEGDSIVTFKDKEDYKVFDFVNGFFINKNLLIKKVK